MTTTQIETRGEGQNTVATMTNGRIRAWTRWNGFKWVSTWSTVQDHNVWSMIVADGLRSFDENVANMRKFVEAAR